MKNLETVARVHTHTHTHTQGNLINKKETSMKNALLMIDKKIGKIFTCLFCV